MPESVTSSALVHPPVELWRVVEGGDLVTRVRRFMSLSMSFQVLALESVHAELDRVPEQGGCHSVCEGLWWSTILGE